MQENLQNNEEHQQNNQQDKQDIGHRTDTKKENLEKISILELQQKYEIGRTPFYNRMAYLQITTWKVSGKAYLDAEQVAHMDGLHEHIKQTGRMEGYPVPLPSGPISEAEPEPKNAIAIVQPEESVPTPPNSAPNYTPDQPRQTETQNIEQINKLIESAQSKAAGMIIAENLLARQFLQNPQMLPEELQQKIKESAEVPVIDPFAYAESLMKFAQI
jgi:hypothetical protein